MISGLLSISEMHRCIPSVVHGRPLNLTVLTTVFRNSSSFRMSSWKKVSFQPIATTLTHHHGTEGTGLGADAIYKCPLLS